MQLRNRENCIRVWENPPRQSMHILNPELRDNLRSLQEYQGAMTGHEREIIDKAMDGEPLWVEETERLRLLSLQFLGMKIV